MLRLDGAVDFLGIANVTALFRLPYLTSTLMAPFEPRCSSSCRDSSSLNAHWVHSPFRCRISAAFATTHGEEKTPFQHINIFPPRIVSSNPRIKIDIEETTGRHNLRRRLTSKYFQRKRIMRENKIKYTHIPRLIIACARIRSAENAFYISV